MLNAGQGGRTSIHQTYFAFVPLFSKPILTRQNMASTKNSQTFLESQVSVFRRNIATNSCTSNHHFSAAFKAFVLGKFIQAFLDLTSHAHGKFAAQG